MTLIVGIKCSDGVVIGADGAATLGNSLGQPTVVQQVVKLDVIEDKIIMGVSGPVGLGQLYTDRIHTLWRNREFTRAVTLPEAMRKVRDAILQDAMVAMQGAAVSAQFLGNVAQIGALTGSLMALPIEGTAELIELDHQATPEAKTIILPHVAIGSGQAIADPFMAFLSRVFWPNSLPNLANGIFATMWTLKHTIKVNPGGVSDPIEIAVLSYKGQEIQARKLEDPEKQLVEQEIADAEEHIKRFRDPTQPLSATHPPEPPSQ